ncbi:ABC transporter substrate-binding protein [Paenibacillus selenitireducens]|uniref:ABC transporter substrate-binding protein n=1 Tax=Paenibacillus selenitireducens TaxID=1324314 RepID=A0A1T2XK80_9BACL|nr:ABC transporter substrate-binding protein [Paenibacillus selenitireducens]OPA80126.1 ABC transporter substrate-binding protein [Paenibacillus selenitireducens]
MKNRTRQSFWLLCLALLVIVAGCGTKEAGTGNESNAESGQTQDAAKELTKVKVVLDWTPNTNHTGLYVARDKGFFKEQGLDVEIVQPGESGADQMVAAGNAEFGVSYQENITLGRTQSVPLVSLAAVIQHNTSGFASPVSKNIKTPKDFEGKTYGGWGSPNEEAMLQSLMETENADVKKVNNVSIGSADYFTATKSNIDFAWIYYAWTGVEAELRKEPMNMVYLKDYSPKLDYYTPVLATSEKMIAEKPDLVRAFVAGAAAGYEYAIANPDDAANILIQAEPDLNPELVKASQKWLSPRYQDDAAQWGVQKSDVWKNYAEWMTEHKLLTGTFEADKAFTNDFLPKK